MTSSARRLDRAGLRSRLILMLAVMVIVSVAAVGYAAMAAFDRAIGPELENRTRLIGIIVRAEIQQALALGIPIGALGGLDSYLEATLEKFSEVDRITVTSAAGEPVAVAERPVAPVLAAERRLSDVVSLRANSFVLPILDGNKLVGEIRVEISPLFVQTQLRDVFLDVMVLALIATLVALELSLAVTISMVAKPLDRVFRLLHDQAAGDFRHCIRPGGLSGLGRAAARLNDHAEDLAARLSALPEAIHSRIEAAIAAGRPERLRLSDFNDIRLALFLFSVAAEIATAFLPIFARTAERPAWLEPGIAAAAPLITYLVAVAALAPFGSGLVRRFGARRLFLASIVPTAVALTAMAFSDNLLAIAIWRGLIGVFYATATVACLEYVVRAVGGSASARAFTAFIAVIYGGVFAGSALGGLLAGRFGFATAFLMGAALALLAGALGAASMRGRAGDAGTVQLTVAQPAVPTPGRRRVGLRFVALALGVAIPMHAATAIFVTYLTPLMLTGGGSGLAETGRVVMLYALMLVLFASPAARVADSRFGPAAAVTVGALAAAAALLSLTLWAGFWAIVAAMAGLGLGHSLIRAPLYARAIQLSGGPGRLMDVLRLLERIGAILGLAACAFLLDDIGAEESIRILGFVVLVGAAVYAVAEISAGLRRRQDVKLHST